MDESNIKITTAKYSIGDLVHHKLFDYRGVIVDIDPDFQLSEEWYEMVARGRTKPGGRPKWRKDQSSYD